MPATFEIKDLPCTTTVVKSRVYSKKQNKSHLLRRDVCAVECGRRQRLYIVPSSVSEAYLFIHLIFFCLLRTALNEHGEERQCFFSQAPERSE